MFRAILALVLLMGLLLSLTGSAVAAPPLQQPSDRQLIDQLKQNTQDQVRISYHAETGKVNFIGTDLAHPMPQPGLLPLNAGPETAARVFLTQYGQLFGLKDQAGELSLVKEQVLSDGRAFARFQQRFQNVPVVGGQLIVQLNKSSNIVSANGEILPNLDLSTTPVISAEAARQVAVAKIGKAYSLDPAELTASTPQLWIYNPSLLGGPGLRLSVLVWRTEVTPLHLRPIREFVLVDAQQGGVVLNFNQIDTALNRQTYTANNSTSLPGALVCNEANPTCSGGDAHAVAAHRYAGDTYNFYFSYHNRNSINNAGMTLISTVHYGSSYANAFWNGMQMVYGDAYGFALADDVVAHELTHGVTDYESELFYYYQSGAINESFSDVWGEFVDLTNGMGNDSAGVRWQMGEDVSGLGAIRNMQNPTLFGDPDRVTSLNYYTGSSDNGGVHTNSGVNNKAAYLITDGATFNGQTVTGLGITKAAKIYYEAQTNLLVSGADYADLYNLLYQACLNLVGTAGITTGNCQEVRDATNAVEMNLQPTPGFNTDVALCPVGQSAQSLFSDTLESGTGNWSAGALVGSSRWGYDSPSGRYAHSGLHSLYASDNPPATTDAYVAMNSSVTLPAGAYLHFAHAYGFEGPSYDGGVVEYSPNSGVSWNDAGGLFDFNGYDGTINTGFGNPLGGRSAFLGDSHGYISSRLNLASLAGQSVRFRWRMGLDSSVSNLGWFVDDVQIYTCGAGLKQIFLPAIMKNLSGGGIVNGNFEAGPTGWSQYSTHGWPLIVTSFPGGVVPHSGSWAVWLGGDYDDISFIQQQVTVSSSAPYLAYWHWIASADVCGYDFGGVLINGAVVSVYNLCSSTNTGGWVKRVINLGAYAGQTISLQIRAEADSSLNSNLFVDDVSFQSTATLMETSGPAPQTGAALEESMPKVGSLTPATPRETDAADFSLRPEGWVPKEE